MLEVGNFGWTADEADEASVASNSLAFRESRTHFGAWAVVSSPLVLGLDVTDDARVTAVWPILSNAEVIAVNQAWAGDPGRLLESADSYQIWAKALPRGAIAALVFNRGSSYATVSVPLASLGLPETVEARDLWTHAPSPASEVAGGNWTTTLSPHDSSFVRFAPKARV